MQLSTHSVIQFFIPITSVILMTVSCKPKPSVEPNYCTTSPGGCNSVLIAKEFFLFKPGSWWVYEEEYSGVRDSMYVYSYYDSDGYDFDVRIKSALDNFEYHYWPEYNANPNDNQCDPVAPVAKKCMNIKRSKGITGSPGVSLGDSRCMFFQYNLHDSVYSGNLNYSNNFIHITSIMDEFDLGTFSFNVTIKVHDPHDKHCRDYPTNHYFSKGVGLVKLELLDTTETWNLVNYYIAP